MILVDAPYGERMDREEVQDLLEELRYRVKSIVSPCDTYDESDEFGKCVEHVDLVWEGRDFHAYATDGTVPELMDRLENALDRLGVAS